MRGRKRDARRTCRTQRGRETARRHRDGTARVSGAKGRGHGYTPADAREELRCTGSLNAEGLADTDAAARCRQRESVIESVHGGAQDNAADSRTDVQDRKSTRLNSSHQIISYAVFCLKKKKKNQYSSEDAVNRNL